MFGLVALRKLLLFALLVNVAIGTDEHAACALRPRGPWVCLPSMNPLMRASPSRETRQGQLILGPRLELADVYRS